MLAAAYTPYLKEHFPIARKARAGSCLAVTARPTNRPRPYFGRLRRKAAAISYNVDLFLFGRFVDRNLAPGVIDAARRPTLGPPSDPSRTQRAFSSSMRRRGICPRCGHADTTTGFAVMSLQMPLWTSVKPVTLREIRVDLPLDFVP